MDNEKKLMAANDFTCGPILPKMLRFMLPILGAGFVFILAYNLTSAIFRGLGDSKSPLLFVAIVCAVNIFGDLLLIAGFKMNVAGAALATVAAQAVSVILSQTAAILFSSARAIIFVKSSFLQR